MLVQGYRQAAHRNIKAIPFNKYLDNKTSCLKSRWVVSAERILGDAMDTLDVWRYPLNDFNKTSGIF